MHLDTKVFNIIKKEENKAKTFDYWLSLATLDKGRRVLIPLKENPYAEKKEGKFLNFIQITEKEGNIIIKRIKQLITKKYNPITPVVSIDIGLNPLFATDKGDLIGRQFLSFLISIDEKITKRMSYLQKSRIKPSQDKKYLKMIEKLRSFLKNEINRYLNKIVEMYKPAKIVIEKLDFRNPGLSRRMNRLIQRFGKRYFKEKLNRLKELYRIDIEENNPAYTSQTCSNCGYVDKNNRKDTQTFECKACGRKINAQVNGARNILKRSSHKEIKISTLKKESPSDIGKTVSGEIYRV